MACGERYGHKKELRTARIAILNSQFSIFNFQLELLCEEEFHYLDSGFGDAGAGAEDGGYTCLVEVVVVLHGNHTASGDDDVLTA